MVESAAMKQKNAEEKIMKQEADHAVEMQTLNKLNADKYQSYADENQRQSEDY